jgi:hypothetical protein
VTRVRPSGAFNAMTSVSIATGTLLLVLVARLLAVQSAPRLTLELEPPDDVFRVLDMYRLPRHTRVFVGGGVRR